MHEECEHCRGALYYHDIVRTSASGDAEHTLGIGGASLLHFHRAPPCTRRGLAKSLQLQDHGSLSL